MTKFLNGIITNFGFNNTEDFSNSMFHPHLLMITLPIAAISACIENIFGLHIMTLIAFIMLLIVELMTGLAASKKKGIKIESRKFGRFGLKLTVWLILFFVINSLKIQYSGNSSFIYGLYDWLHDGLMIYVSLEYLISVIENLGVLTGKKNSGLIIAIKKKVGMNEDGYNEFFNISADLLAISNKDGKFVKLNDAWTEVLGWSKNELISLPIISFIHSDDIKKAKAESIKLNTDATFKSVNFITRFKTKEGGFVTLSWSTKSGSGGNLYSTIRVID